MKKVLVIIVIAIVVVIGWSAWRYQSIKNPPVCGGIAGKICPAGYTCKGMAQYPDAQGYCVKD